MAVPRRLTSASKYYFSHAPANEYVMGFTVVTSVRCAKALHGCGVLGADARRERREEIEDKSPRGNHPAA
jgi:hypothetical protein